jgi:hypothetical protein
MSFQDIVFLWMSVLILTGGGILVGEQLFDS